MFNFCKISFKRRTDVNRPEDNQTRFAKHLANPGCRSRFLDNKNQKRVPLDLFHCNNGISILLVFRSPDILKQFSTSKLVCVSPQNHGRMSSGWVGAKLAKHYGIFLSLSSSIQDGGYLILRQQSGTIVVKLLFSPLILCISSRSIMFLICD